VPLIAATLVLGLVQVAGASYNYDGKKWNTCPTETLFKTVSIPNGTLKIYSCNNNGYFAHVTAKQGPASLNIQIHRKSPFYFALDNYQPTWGFTMTTNVVGTPPKGGCFGAAAYAGKGWGGTTWCKN
jgi:hypothetical protein